MKILHIINSLFPAGAEKLLLDTLPLYREAGIEVDLLVLLDDDYPFLKKLRELDCCIIYVLKNSKNIRHIYSPLNIIRMKRILRQYDIAHVHLFPAQYFAVFANLLNGNRTKLVFTEHNTSNRRLKNRFLKPIQIFIYKQYDRLICISDEISSIYQDYLGSFIDPVVIPNGVDIGKIFEAKKVESNLFLLKEENSTVSKFILQVSAFRTGKEQKVLIDALGFLGEEYGVVLVGIGETESEVKSYVARTRFKDRVFFLGARMDIPQLLKLADFIVLSSAYEGLSLSSIEGLASGRPFIASDVPGLRHVVSGAGILFKRGNSEELAKIIKELDEDECLYQSTVEKCIARAREYGIDVMIQKHIALYKQLFRQV